MNCLRQENIVKLIQVSDLRAVMELERESGLSSWDILSYERELLNPEAVMLGLYGATTKLLNGFFSGRIVADEGEVLSLVVRRDQRRAGLGAQLLAAALTKMVGRGIVSCWLEVRSQNFAAIQLYEKFGFCVAGRRRNYYHEPLDDALVMQWKRDSSASV